MSSFFSWLKPYDWIVTTAICVLGFFLTVAWRYQDRTRVIAIEVLEQIPLSRPSGSISQKLQLVFGDSIVSEPYVTRVRIKNDGYSAIAADDFDGPIVIELGEGKSVLEVSIENKKPQDFKVLPDLSGGSVKIAPLLLNQDDEFTVGILSSGGKPTVLGSFHVKNAAKPVTRIDEAIDRQIVEFSRRTVVYMSMASLFSAIVFGMALTFIRYCFSRNITLWVHSNIVAVACFVTIHSIKEPLRYELLTFLPGSLPGYVVTAVQFTIYVLLMQFGTSSARKSLKNIEQQGIFYKG